MLGLVTIGQAPRDDVVRSMFGNDSPPLAQAGAIDFLDNAQIDALAPGSDDYLLVSRLRDGREVTLAKRLLLPLLEDAIAGVEAAGASLVCVLCTGEFPPLRSRSRVVFPERLLVANVNALLSTGTLGILMPHERQREPMLRKWSLPGRAIVTGSVSPYSPQADIASAGRDLAARGAELIVMDCMGFDRDMQAVVRTAAAAPVVLANGLVGAVLRESVGLARDALQHA